MVDDLVVTGQTMVAVQPEPDDIIKHFTKVADHLGNVVEQQKLYAHISGKKYLTAEAWETVVSLDNAVPRIVYCKAVQENGVDVAYEAMAEIVKDGAVIASGVMACGFDDFPGRGKTGWAQRRAVMSAAQTWAIAKAARGKYAWVVTLKGYAPTPAEEMEGTTPAAKSTEPAKGLGACPVHEVPWQQMKSKKNNATWLSHRNGEEWCNERDVADNKPMPQAAVVETVGRVVPEQPKYPNPDKLPNPMHRDLLDEYIAKIGWDENDIRSYLGGMNVDEYLSENKDQSNRSVLVSLIALATAGDKVSGQASFS